MFGSILNTGSALCHLRCQRIIAKSNENDEKDKYGYLF
jgi:hypothetical protein